MKRLGLLGVLLVVVFGGLTGIGIAGLRHQAPPKLSTANAVGILYQTRTGHSVNLPAVPEPVALEPAA